VGSRADWFHQAVDPLEIDVERKAEGREAAPELEVREGDKGVVRTVQG
jgi:hypothetical protein